MKSLRETSTGYVAELAERAKKSRVRRSHQFVGLEIAVILKDWQHRTLYMKLAKERNAHELLSIAKSVAEKKDVANRGAYFMRVVMNGQHRKQKKRA